MRRRTQPAAAAISQAAQDPAPLAEVHIDSSWGSSVVTQAADLLSTGAHEAFAACLGKCRSLDELAATIRELASNATTADHITQWYTQAPQQPLAQLLEASRLALWGNSKAAVAASKAEYDGGVEQLRRADAMLHDLVTRVPTFALPWTTLIWCGSCLRLSRYELLLRHGMARAAGAPPMFTSLYLVTGLTNTPDEMRQAAARCAADFASLPAAQVFPLLAEACAVPASDHTSPAFRDLVDRSAAASVDSPNFDDTSVEGAIALNVVAFAYVQTRDLGNFARLHRRIAGRVGPEPWNFFERPGLAYAKAVADAGLAAS